ncbi:uncharacterized protein BXZ73DRAFT_57232, partial [Epithele typhae]|uniref:uncharacterized protein n=1 Tax=Epithele typhae TaxID=378194 RepID=UPI002008B50B
MLPLIPRRRSLQTLFLSFLWSLPSPCRSKAVNVTIDDYYGDSRTGALPTFDPAGTTEGAGCDSCNINRAGIDPSQIFRGTWHESTNRDSSDKLTITATFTGTAVYVYNVIAINEPGISLSTNLQFLIDGQSVGTYVRQQSNTATPSFQYNVPVFGKTGLSNSQHTIQLVSAEVQGVTIFDYFEYT